MGFLLLCILPTAQKSIMGKRGRPLGFLWAYYEALPSVQAEYWQLGQSPDTPPFTDHMTQPHAAPSQTHGRSSRSAKGDGRRLLVATRGHTQPEPPEHRVPQPCRSWSLVCKLGKPLESSPVQPSPNRWKIQNPRKQKATHLRCVGPSEPDRKAKTFEENRIACLDYLA
ncbi:hypothetical protein PG996_007385 [Apiospora saccharicola]|uniref:Uncharacterized protein n=1 Tax=Apiospora saccharicola TaxID=335842 RepID=A0ABR1VAS1_9PEZI